MLKSLKSTLCLALSAVIILACAGCTDAEQESSSQSEAVTEQTAASANEATADEEQEATQAKSLNYNQIKLDTDTIKSEFDNIITKNKFRGVVYSKLGNDFEYIGSNGFADKDNRTNNSINTTYYAGSLTKQFTAAAILLLQEDGKLSISDTIDKYYPDCKYADTVTVENLLTMTAGLKDCFNQQPDDDMSSFYMTSELPYEISEDADAGENQNSIVNWILEQDVQSEPGTEFAYSNSAYYLLGDIIEKVSGKSYEDYLQENIFDPLSMTSTGFEADDTIAAGYQDVYDNSWELYPGVAYSAAGLITSVPDMLKWFDALSDNTILSEESFEAMTTPYLSNYGYGLYISDDGNFYHSGSIYRFNSYILVSSDMSNIYIAFSNYTQSDPNNVYSQMSAYLNKYLE
ncbi:MAG: beta-lactamase family protein [Clostridiales bacterium]|nr:beta-lactamase family protein [Clostridiales bacterium]